MTDSDPEAALPVRCDQSPAIIEALGVEESRPLAYDVEKAAESV